MITRVMIDNGSSLNVLSKITLDKLYSPSLQLRTSFVVVRAFDGSKREVMGVITLPIRIDPITFDITFLIMDIQPAYSCLLGIPYIHAIGVIPSSLHQKVKFITWQQLINVMREKELIISTPTPTKYIEGDEKALETSFQSLEVASTTHAKPGNLSPSRAEIMAAQREQQEVSYFKISKWHRPSKNMNVSLEELERGNWPSSEKIAKLLKVPEVEILRARQQRSGVEGIPLSYLEERMSMLIKFGNWDLLADTLGLAIYRIVLLLHLNDYVDLAVIDAFIAVKEKGLSPTVVVLANTYYSLQRCHDGRGGRLVCCLPALYVWLISHIFVSKCPTTCPIEDHKWCLVPNKNGSEWAMFLASLTDKTFDGIQNGTKGMRSSTCAEDS
ncbi:hypothetical protein CR513_43132, partial [Mucuna pruriens]